MRPSFTPRYAGAFGDLDGHAWETARNPGFDLDDDGSIVSGPVEGARSALHARATEFRA